MKRIITLLLLLSAKSAFSQSTDLDPQSFNLSYVSLPQKAVVDKKNRTYTVTTTADNVYNAKATQDFFEENFSIDAFKRQDSNGYLQININLWVPLILSPEISKVENVIKDSKGKVQSVDVSFKTIIKCRDLGSFEVVCASDPSFNKKYSLDNSFTDEGLFASYADAVKYGNEAVISIKNDYFSRVKSSMDERMNRDYGYVVQQTTDYLWILDSKKHPESDNNLNALKNVKAVFNKMRYDEDVAALKIELEPTIKYFESVEKTYAEDERKHKKLRYGAYYNLATIYYYLDMPVESDIWCDKLIANGYDISDGRGMKFRNESLKELFTINQVQTRHMDVEARTNGVETEVRIDAANFDPNYFLKNDPKYNLISLVLTTNDTISGYVKKSEIVNLDKKIAVSIPDEKGNHNYMFKSYYADQVSKLIVKEDDFYSTVSFKETGKNARAKPAYKFVRPILNGKTVSLYQYLTGEIIVKKHSDEIGYSANSVGWQMNTRTKFVELANACPVLASRANRNEFNTSLESLWKFVEALDVCK
jgi:hypothetical protein